MRKLVAAVSTRSYQTLPPRKKDWKPGTTQLGLFIRLADGSVFEISQNDAPPETAGFAMKLMAAMVQGLTPKEKL